jgi:hypothetical protein
MLKSSDFSVIVQGPIHSSPDRPGERDVTVRCLASIRTFLPGAEIILSTWQDAAAEGLDYDLLVRSDDPGAILHSSVPPLSRNNVNRQIISTAAGLAVAQRPFAVKFRGDLCWNSARVLACDDFSSPLNPQSLFRSRILISPYHTRNPRKYPLLFHYSDIVQVGRTEDLRKLWSVPTAPEPETTRWREGRKARFFAPVIETHYLRVWPEQYLVLALLGLCGQPTCLDQPWEVSAGKILLSESVLLENFRVLQLEQLGVCFPPRLYPPEPDAYFYQSTDWDRLSLAYTRQPQRFLAQSELLLLTYWRAFEFYLRNYVRHKSIRNASLYRWAHACYRRLFPL